MIEAGPTTVLGGEAGRLGPRAKRRGQRLKNHLLYALVRALLFLLGRLPRRPARRLGRGLARLGFWLARPERARARRNLAAALPELSRQRRGHLLGQSFAQLGEGVVECAQLDRDRGRWLAGVSFAAGARESLLAALAEGRGVIYVTAHLGNWELMAAAVAQLAPVAVLYKPSYDSRLTRRLCAFRQASGVRGLDVTAPGHVGEAVALLRRGSVLGILLDQPAAGGVPVPFLGRPALTSRVAPVLARRTGAAVVAGFALRTGTCQHRIQIQRLRDPAAWKDARSALRLLNQPLEAAILGSPAQWTWSLDRWRGAL